MPQLPNFAEYVKLKVDDLLASGAEVDPDLASMSDPPSVEADEFQSMWAYGWHFRCLPERDEVNTHETYDSGVFVLSPQECRASTSDTNFVAATLPYVGVLKKIIVVSYGTTNRILMKCSWVVPNLAGNPTVRQDDHGFWLVKKNCRQNDIQENPYVFPYSVSQVRKDTIRNSIKMWKLFCNYKG